MDKDTIDYLYRAVEGGDFSEDVCDGLLDALEELRATLVSNPTQQTLESMHQRLVRLEELAAEWERED